MKIVAVLHFQGWVNQTQNAVCIYKGEENDGVSRGETPLDSGFPIGARSIPVGTRFCLQSLVCYTFVEQMSAENVAHLGKCGYSCGVLAGKVAPYGAA